MRDATFSLATTSSLPVPRPQLRIQIEEDNAFDNFAVAIWKDVIYMWQSREEIEGYSVVYFDCIAGAISLLRAGPIRASYMHKYLEAHMNPALNGAAMRSK